MEPQFSASNSGINYASFRRRLVAWLIDLVVVTIAQNYIVIPVLIAAKLIPDISDVMLDWVTSLQSKGITDPNELLKEYAKISQLILPVIMPISFLINASYFVFMESSVKQGTLGKMALGIIVTDLENNRITPVKAFLRYTGKYISQFILFLGYLMAAFTPKRQALHDILAGTLVLKK